jgi:hypothetical protein
LCALLVFWLAAKAVFVHVVVPARDHDRQPRAKGETISACVPAGVTLYLFGFKDEGILFYYGRPAVRLAHPGQLPSSPKPHYCIVEALECPHMRWPGQYEQVLNLRDEQGASFMLVRCQATVAAQASSP